MDKLKMHSRDNVAANVEAVGRLFPNALTEVMRDGKVVPAIDFDVLRQELSREIVEGREERYAFTWPDKRQAILAANAPIAMTLRPVVADSVGRDGTPGAFDSENLYIEGDNLDVLKLLQETYLGKVKMIYIDPPYNTGSDAFVYDDDFAMENGEFVAANAPYDEHGNVVYDFKKNLDSNGRFHTDWLNMIYPRLRVAKSLLADDGVIFISVDYNENFNMRKVADEILGEQSFIGEIYWESKTKSQNTKTAYNKLQPKAEMILVYAKDRQRRFRLIEKGVKEYPFSDERGVYREYPVEVMNASGVRGRESMIYEISDTVSTVFPPAGKQWQLGQAQVATYLKNGDLFIRDGKPIIKMRPDGERNETTEPFWGFFDKSMGTAESAKKELGELIENHGFETVKPVEIIKRLCFHATDKDAIILDFFSGSATTAHAVMQLNAEDGGHRKFIMVQLPEASDEGGTAYKAGYENICEIGKERIRRAGTKIAAAAGEKAAGLDLGFRCLRLDMSNMTEVYYAPDAVTQDGLFAQVDNVKADRTPEDLLFQTMLDLGILLSSSIVVEEVAGRRVFNVADGFLLACFDRDVTDEVVTAIAQRRPYYAVFRDASMADDSALTNFDQLFAAYSPATVRRVL